VISTIVGVMSDMVITVISRTSCHLHFLLRQNTSIVQLKRLSSFDGHQLVIRFVMSFIALAANILSTMPAFNN